MRVQGWYILFVTKFKGTSFLANSYDHFDGESLVSDSFLGWMASTTASISSFILPNTLGAFTSSTEVRSSISSFLPCVSLWWRGDLSCLKTASNSSLARSRMFGAFTSFPYKWNREYTKKEFEFKTDHLYRINCHNIYI